MKYLLVALVFVPSFEALGQVGITCRGEVRIQDYGVSAAAILSIDKIVEGQQIELSQPITSDNTSAISLTIQRVIETNAGVRVIATYDDLVETLTGFLTFRYHADLNGMISLSDFKGFEGETSFGVGTLSCQ